MIWSRIGNSLMAAAIVVFGEGVGPIPAADTPLDRVYSDVTADLVGCNAQSNDRVLVNGRAQDGVLWTLVDVRPAAELSMDAILRITLAKMNQPIPTSYPELRFRLKPGYYGELTVSVGDCSFAPFPLTAPQGIVRNILLIPNAALPPSNPGDAGVYVNAPLPDLQISLTGSVSQQPLVARNEVVANPFIGPHGALYGYFFDAVNPGRYTMTVSGFGWTKRLGEVVVSQPGELVLRTIQNSDLGIH